MSTCPRCGAADKYLVAGKCDECHEREHGMAALEYDPLGACGDYRADTKEAVGELFERSPGGISDPIECAVATLLDYCHALEDAIRYRDRVKGAPPPWQPVGERAP